MRAVAIEMQQAELMLRRGMPLFRRPSIPGGGIGAIGEHPVSTGVEQSQAIRGLGIPGKSRNRPLLEGRGIICSFVSLTPTLHRRSGSDRKSTRLNSSHSSISYAVF